jgi:hypothetical protein
MEPLEVAIALTGDSPGAVEGIRAELARADILCLGHPAGPMATPQEGAESDLLHVTMHDAQGTERLTLPVFTDREVLRAALARNPDWQVLSVLQVQGRAILEQVHPDVIIVINPWSRLQFQIPPARRSAG